MINCLVGLEPAKVLEFFGNLCQIPHGSKNEKAISDYICQFCIDRNLEVWQDAANNLIIKKDATPGYEDAPIVILQAHLDMVCEKNADTVHDFKKDPIRVLRDGDRIYADGTTLGADNATGVAFAMAVLDAGDIPHPRLEVVLTSDEEAGMSGIRALDFSRLEGRVIINLDCSDEGIVVGCAGTAALRLDLDLAREAVPEGSKSATLIISGLKGGHSGLDIAEERGNANLLLARVLSDLQQTYGIQIAGVNGGLQTNAICREAAADIVFAAHYEEQIKAGIAWWQQIFGKEFKISDPNICLQWREECESAAVFTAESSTVLLDALLNIDCGVITMNREVENVPETSGNIGIVRSDGSHLTIWTLYRSCLGSKKQYVIEKNRRLARLLGADITVESSSPEWEYKADSRLSALIQRIYQKRYGKQLIVEVSHGGNECGTFFKQFPDADIVCTGTKITGAHTPDESVLVSTIQKEWEMLCLTLAGMLEY